MRHDRILVFFLALTALTLPAARAQNLLNNGKFAGTLTPWVGESDELYYSALSASADGTGSAEAIMILTGSVYSGTGNGLVQCVSGISAGTTYAFGARIYVPGGQPESGGGFIAVQWYTGTACDGLYLDAANSNVIDTLNEATGHWWPTRAAQVAPQGARSAVIVGAIVSRAPGTPYHVFFDEIYFQSAGCQVSPSRLCLDDFPQDGRFAVSTHYSTAQGGGLSGDGQAVPLGSLGVGHGGLLWFFDPGNPELLAKVLDGCAVNGHFWVFLTAGTNVGMTTTVRDSFSGRTQTYVNPDRHAAAPVQDTTAFPCTAGDVRSRPAKEARAAGAPRRGALVAPTTASCANDTSHLCIDGRFRVEAVFHTSQGGGFSGTAGAIPLTPLGVTAGGLLWFFDSGNPEMLLKVLDGCSVNGRFWIFYSATTNAGFTVTVTDTTTGAAHSYPNADLHPAAPVQDTQGLACP